MTTASSPQDLASVMDSLVAALVQIERLAPSRIGARQRIELLWASEQLRSFGATPRSTVVPSGDSDLKRVKDAAAANRDFTATLDDSDVGQLTVEAAQLRRIAGVVDVALAARESTH